MLRALDPSRPPRRRTAAPRHLVMGAGPSVQPSWARTLPPAGLQKCERQQCVCPVSFGCAVSNCRVLRGSVAAAGGTRRAEEEMAASTSEELLSGHPSHCFVGLAEFTRFYKGSEIGRMPNPPKTGRRPTGH